MNGKRAKQKRREEAAEKALIQKTAAAGQMIGFDEGVKWGFALFKAALIGTKGIGDKKANAVLDKTIETFNKEYREYLNRCDLEVYKLYMEYRRRVSEERGETEDGKQNIV